MEAPVATYFCEYDDQQDEAFDLVFQEAMKSYASKQVGPDPSGTEKVGTLVQPEAEKGNSSNGTQEETALSEAIAGDGEEVDKTATEAIGALVRGLSYQLCEQDKKYEKELTDHLRVVLGGAGHESTIRQTFNTLFRNGYFNTIQPKFVRLIIDGIDNLSLASRPILYTLLKDIIDSAKENGKSTVKIIALSQPQLKEETRRIIPETQLPSIVIDEEKNRADIEKYISWSIRGNSKLKRAFRDPKLQSDTIKTIASTTKGVFESLELFPYLRSMLIVCSGRPTVKATL